MQGPTERRAGGRRVPIVPGTVEAGALALAANAIRGPKVAEIRVEGERAYRVLYVARYPEAVYVLHVFEKKARKTSNMDLEIGRARYREMTRLRAGRQQGRQA